MTVPHKHIENLAVLGGLPQILKKSHAAGTESCGNSSKERSPGIGQQHVTRVL